VGDVLLQTEWQAVNKITGLADALGRRALTRHVLTYMLAFIPALVWIGSLTTAWRAIAIGLLVGIPHLLIDDGTFVRFWLREVKGADRPSVGLTIATDQSLHVVCLLAAALLAAA
jgi:hypothetical protein